MRRALWVVIVLLAVVIDGFFALVNFYPVAPPRDPGPPQKVVVALDAAQAKWLSETLIAEFNREHDANIELVFVDDSHLLAALEGTPSPLLVAIPRVLGARAASAGLTRSFADVVPAKRLEVDLGELAPPVVEAAKVDGKPYFLPRWSLLHVTVYRASRVRDAVRHWALLRGEIDAAMKAVNGRGLPAGYQLELSPDEWDAYDRFVIGYFWARRRYGKEPARGRIGHRAGERLDEVVDVVEGIYRAGATDKTVADTASAASRDYFAWEALYQAHGLYAPAMLKGEPIDDEAILAGLQRGELYLATVNPMQAFTLHGGASRGRRPQIANPGDLGFAPLPLIPSLELDVAGRPVRKGRGASFREDWVWALPARSPSPKLAYELVQFLWQRDQNYRECEALGTVPLRRDVIRERSTLFKPPWMSEVYDAVFAQWKQATPQPEAIASGLASVYAQLWDRIVGQHAEPAAVEAILHAPPSARPAPAARPQKPPTRGEKPVAPVSPDKDDDESDEIDDALWRGRVELERGPQR